MKMHLLQAVFMLCGPVSQTCSAPSQEWDARADTKISSYKRLRTDILNRPVLLHKIPPDVIYDESESYNLTFLLRLLDVYDIDELNQVITLNAYIDIRWTQKQLAWAASNYSGLNFIYVDKDRLWTPTILIVMGQKDSFVLDFADTLIINSDGEVISRRHNHLTFSCSIDFDKYPFDVQSCSVGFYPMGLKSLPNIEIQEMQEYTLSEYINISGEWLFVDETHDIVKADDGEPIFPRYYFRMKRQRTYYIITFIFPMVLTSVMIPLAFLIPAYTGEKLSYLVAMFTSTAIYLNYISDVMPRSLSQMPYLAIFLIEVLVEGLLAMMGSLVIVSMYLKEQMQARQRMLDRKAVTNSIPVLTKDGKEKPVLAPTVVQDVLPSNTGECLTSRRLDFIFFFSFLSGQVLFLTIMFGFMDWV